MQGLPLVKPPYGRISAIDLNKGEILWQIAHGETPDNIQQQSCAERSRLFLAPDAPGMHRHVGN